MFQLQGLLKRLWTRNLAPVKSLWRSLPSAKLQIRSWKWSWSSKRARSYGRYWPWKYWIIYIHAYNSSSTDDLTKNVVPSPTRLAIIICSLFWGRGWGDRPVHVLLQVRSNLRHFLLHKKMLVNTYIFRKKLNCSSPSIAEQLMRDTV